MPVHGFLPPSPPLLGLPPELLGLILSQVDGGGSGALRLTCSALRQAVDAHSTALTPTAAGERDYAVTITRNFLFSALMVLVWNALKSSTDQELAAIAAKSLKEAQYHLRHSRDWLVKFGDGTEVSHARVQAALDHLMPYTQEFWTPCPMEAAAVRTGAGVDNTTLKASWDAIVDGALAEATLKRPAAGGYVTTGKLGVHSEHMGFVLAEMQSLARVHPEAVW